MFNVCWYFYSWYEKYKLQTHLYAKQRHVQQNTSASLLIQLKPWVLPHISISAYAALYEDNEHSSHTNIYDTRVFFSVLSCGQTSAIFPVGREHSQEVIYLHSACQPTFLFWRHSTTLLFQEIWLKIRRHLIKYYKMYQFHIFGD